MTQSDFMLSTGALEMLKSITSRMDYPSTHVLKYRSYLLSISVVLIINEILRHSIPPLLVVTNVEMVHWIWCILPFSHNFQILNHSIQPEGYYWQHRQCDLVLDIFWRRINMFPIYWMCLISLNMDKFYRSFFSKYSCLYVLLRRGYFPSYLWSVYLINLPWLVALFLDIFFQWL